MIPNRLKSSTNQRNPHMSPRTRFEGLLFGGASLEMASLGSTIKWPDGGGE